MSMTKQQQQQNEELAARCEERLTDNQGEKEPGQCWRFQRLNINSVLGTRWLCPPIGSDAYQAFRYFQKLGYEVDGPLTGIPGDLIFFGPTAHNEHGHVCMRIKGNRVGENYSPHVNLHPGDARGTRPLSQLHGVIGCIRLPVK